MADAIATMEGWYITQQQASARRLQWPTRAQVNNNPGNLRSWGSRDIVAGYASFPSPQDGWAALRAQIRNNIYGLGTNFPRRKTHPMTCAEFFAGQRDASGEVLPGGYPGFAPHRDKNNPVGYAQFVANRLGIPADVPLIQLLKEKT